MEKKIYRVSPLTWIVPILCLLFTLFIVSFFIWDIILLPRTIVINGLLTALVSLGALAGAIWFTGSVTMVLWEFPQTTLQLWEGGLIFFESGLSIYTPWENILDIGWTPFARIIPNIIILREPARGGNLSLEEGISGQRAVTEKQIWWLHRRVRHKEMKYTSTLSLPTYLFRRADKERILQDLYQYLPQLLERYRRR